jgi:hypothetical protein
MIEFYGNDADDIFSVLETIYHVDDDIHGLLRSKFNFLRSYVARDSRTKIAFFIATLANFSLFLKKKSNILSIFSFLFLLYLSIPLELVLIK